MDSLDLARLYKEAVEKGLGFVAEIEDDGDVKFDSVDHGTFVISLDADKDPEYFRMAFYNFGGSAIFDNDPNPMYTYMNRINRQKKAVKLWASDCDEKDCEFGKFHVHATIECFLAAADKAPTLDLITSVIRRNYRALVSGVEEYNQFEHLHHTEKD